MITVQTPKQTKDKITYDFTGLSTDTKPTVAKYPQMANGSSFFELDTKSVFFYDEQNGEWR